MATFEEYKKFKMNKPESQREFRTLEIYHPSKTAPIRLVQDYDQYIGRLELSAPRNAGEFVTFQPFTGEIVEPTESNDAEQSISVNIADINSELPKYLDSFDGFDWLEPIQVIYRKYWSADNTQPAIAPAYLFATSPSYDSTNADGSISTSFVASDVDLSQKEGRNNLHGKTVSGACMMNDLAKYIGIPWVYRESDCWALFKLMSSELLCVELHDLNLPDKSSLKENSKIFEDEMASPRWKRVDVPSFGSAIVFYGNSDKAIHIGFAIDKRTVIHSMGSVKTYSTSRCDKIKSLVQKGLFKRYEFYDYTG